MLLCIFQALNVTTPFLSATMFFSYRSLHPNLDYVLALMWPSFLLYDKMESYDTSSYRYTEISYLLGASK